MSTVPLSLLNHTIKGSGSPVILIHGLFGSLENLNALARHLQEDFQVISVDVRNHGGSFMHPSMSYIDMANDVLALMDNLGIDKAAIVGHSMGGKIAMQCALMAPSRVSKLVVADIAPVTYQHSHDNVIKGLLSIDLQAIKNRKDADLQLSKYVEELGVRQFLLKNLAKNESGFYWRANIEVIANAYHQVIAGNQSQTPYEGEVLFIKGSESDYILAEHRPQIIALFPNSKARIIQGTGHWLHAEKPIVFNKFVHSFLS